MSDLFHRSAGPLQALPDRCQGLGQPVTHHFDQQLAVWRGSPEAPFPLSSVEGSEDLLAILVFLAVALRLLTGQQFRADLEQMPWGPEGLLDQFG
jgi:hypothetical protein